LRGRWEAESYLLTAILPGAPAEQAGLRAGDEVIAVNGTSAAGLLAAGAAVRNAVWGSYLDPANERVRLEIRRDDRIWSLELQSTTWVE
jgi:S1-C subfamily serine protease